MVRLTENPSFRDASCCNVEVVKGAVGDLVAGFFSTEETRNTASIFCLKNDNASCSLPKVVANSALKDLPSTVVKSPCTLNVSLGTKFSTSRSRSTTKRRVTDCTRPADRPP